MERERIESYVGKLCTQAGESGEFYRNFCENLFADEEICREFVHYMENGNFACQAKVGGYTVVDVMICRSIISRPGLTGTPREPEETAEGCCCLLLTRCLR